MALDMLTADSLVNLMSHLGDPRDKQAYSQFAHVNYTYQELEIAYRSWLPKKLTRIFPEDMVREGRTVTMDEEDPDKFNTLCDEVRVMPALCDAYGWGRLFGGGGSYMVIKNDDPQKPLVLDRVSPNNPLVSLIPFDRYDVETVINEDPRAPNFLRPEWYRFVDNTQWIHWTRVLGPFDGYKLFNREQKRNLGWGGSEVESIASTVLQALSANASVASLLHRADAMTMGVKGLLNKTQSTTKTAELQRRFAVAAGMVSNNGFMLYDSDAEVPGQIKAELTAPGSLMSEFLSIVAAAADIPVSRFFGTAPKGLNATGEGDRKNYHMAVKGKQVIVFGPELRRLDPVIARSAYGRDVAMTYEWNPLEQPSGLEKAQEDQTRAGVHRSYLDMGVLQPSMIAQELLATGEYNALTQEYVDALETLEGLQDEPEIDEETPKDADQSDEIDTESEQNETNEGG